MIQRIRSARGRVFVLSTALFLMTAGTVLADGGITFTDVAENDGAGITYRRTASPRGDERQTILDNAPIPIPTFASVRNNYTMKGRGVPGIALLDYDGDGDTDMYVTNGPGTPNSLYSNQLEETGQLHFVDVAVAAGIDATDQDSSGVCFGDIDNDGDEDVYVVAIGEANRLFENNGDGTFSDITAHAGVGGSGRHANACSFGDIDNDGLLDVVVANSYDNWTHRLASTTPGPTFPLMEHNYLFHNQGGNQFADVSASSGIENVSNMDHPGLSGGAFTWAIAMVDYDNDGDQDIVCADNQGVGAFAPEQRRGWNRIFQNDGTGQFTDVTGAAGLEVDGGWMGLSFGDMNCDGHMDFFSTNLGDYAAGPGARSPLYLGAADGTFTFGGPNVPNPFGWGTSMFDYDNDGDNDIVYHGSVDVLSLIFADNPGTLIQNEGVCSGNLGYDVDAFTTDHARRTVNGVAVGDLNGDGFNDIVTASNFNIVPGPLYIPFIFATGGPLGSPYDDLARLQVVLTSRVLPGNLVEADPGLELPDGNLSVEISSADNGNNSVTIKTVGAVGVLSNGAVNRSGIGANVTVTPKNGAPVMRPVLGGSSYASQDSLDLTIGIGSAKKATVEIVWPGGVKNSLRNVKDGETVIFPEIPCSYDGAWASYQDYHSCVTDALDDLIDAGLLPNNQRGSFLSSAIDAYNEAQ